MTESGPIDMRRVAVSVRLSPELARRLRAAAQRAGLPMTALVEQACESAPWASGPAPPWQIGPRTE